nr:right-handed parallel beta-helix repeat-containing protein [Gammaproteobacteria bacterium]
MVTPRFQPHRRESLLTAWQVGLAGVALILALASGPVSAATIDVDGFFCTLIDAIEAANTDSARGGCRAGSGPDTLVLRPGSTHTLESVYTDLRGPTGLPVIRSEIRIEGNGATIRREASAPAFRILTVSLADFTLEGVTITGGRLDGPGGGLYAHVSIVSIANSTVSDNTLEGGGFGGGGVSAHDSDLTITDSTISRNNAAGRIGGGVALDNGTVIITGSALSDNSTGSRGGGIRTGFSTATITNSTLSGNTAGSDGGGVAVHNGSATIANSTLSGNTARRSGGGIATSGGGPITITNSTISGNTARHAGGGVLAWPGDSEHLAFDRSIVAGNTANVDSQVWASSGVTVIADNYNLFGTDGDAGVSGFTPGATDIVPAVGVPLRAILNPNLADNGGPTLTHALVSGSPAIDAVPASADCGGTDQRGESRRQDGNGDGVPGCDIGAYEFGGVPPGDG